MAAQVYHLVLISLVLTLECSSAFKIAAFNVANFGAKKMDQPEVLGLVMETIQKYDIILLQEIRDREETAMYEIRSIINDQQNIRYGLRLSERLGRTRSKEQYAFFFRKGTGIDIEDTFQFDDGEDGKCEVIGRKGKWGKILKCPDAFEREPFAVRVKSEKTMVKDFALIGVHVKPDDAINELNHLPEVVDKVMEKWGVKNVMILGDLNADCTYIEKDEWSKVKMRNDPNYHWFIGDDADTTVKSTNCAYDRFIVRGEEMLKAIVPGSAGIFNFQKDYHLNQSAAEAVSDHFPIEIGIKMADGSVEQESCGASPLGYKPTDAELEEEDDGNYVEGVEVVGDEAQEQDDEKQGDDEEKEGQEDERQGPGDKKQGLDDEKRGLKDEEEEDIVEFSDDDDTKDYVEGVDISDDPRMANEKAVYEDDGTEYSEQTSCSSCGGGGEFEDMEGEEDFEEVDDGEVPEVKAVDETEEAPGEETEADGQDGTHAKDEL